MMRLGDHCGKYLSLRAATDKSIWALDGDLADSDGAIHFANEWPERFIMAGIAEQSMVSMAAGMATCGFRPWVFSFASFLTYRAYDQIRVCLSQCRQPVTLVGSHSGGLTGRNGKSHASLNDLALMLSLPYFQVWAPADPADVRFAMDRIMALSDPAYLRLPRRPADELGGVPGAVRVLHPPAAITMVSTGLGTQLAVNAYQYACDRMSMNVIDIGLIHCLQLSPFPADQLSQLLKGVKKIIVVEDHLIFGGLASLVRALAPPGDIVSLGWPPDWHGQSGEDHLILELHGLSPAQIFNHLSPGL
jgi:transketolase